MFFSQMTSEPTSSNSPNMITIVSSDGEEFEISTNLAQQSETLSNLIENFDYHRKDVKKEPIPLENITRTQMEKVLKWMKHHQHAPKWVPADNNYVPDYRFDAWTSGYLNIPNNRLYELVKASNYLNIPRLYDAVSKKVASMIAGKTADEMRRTLNLQPNADEEEEDGSTDDDEEYYQEGEVMSEISLSEDSEED